MAVYESHSSKRTASTAEFDTPAIKKLNRKPIHHHKLTWDLQSEQRRGAQCQDEGAVQSMLTRSIGLALEAVGFEAAAPEAIESFRVDVEEYMAHYLADVRQSMLSCRRTQPTPQDFLQALHTHQLSLRSLLLHLDPPVPPQRSQFSLQKATAQDDEQLQLQFLGPILNSAPDEHTKVYVPKHFPDFPSKHTYKATPEFPDREHDPKRIRERATEEGRLGEEALRRLVGAASDNPAHASQQRKEITSTRARRDQLWMETMQAVTQGAPEEMDHSTGFGGVGKGKQKEGNSTRPSFGNRGLGAAVNAERRYWRKPAAQRREGNGNI